MKKGFTLIELLAVIVIIAIISLIAIPQLSKVVNNAKESANLRSLEGHISNVEYNLATNIRNNTYADGTYAFDDLNFSLYPAKDKIRCESYSLDKVRVIGTTNCAIGNNLYCYNETGVYNCGKNIDIGNDKSSEMDIEGYTLKRVKEIRSTGNTDISNRKGTIYYVSADGDDNNDGLSEATPFKTMDKIDSMFKNPSQIKDHSTILFRDGDRFYGLLNIRANDILIGSYGDISKGKPMLTRSPFNGAKVGTWVEVKPNIWKYTYEGSDQIFTYDMGMLVMYCNKGNNNCTRSMSTIDRKFEYGWKVTTNINFDESNLDNKIDTILTKDLDFYHAGHAYNFTTTGGALYLYSKTNPSKRFDTIEFDQGGHVINSYNSGRVNLIVDNIKIAYAGAFGILTNTTANLVVKNCEIGFVGGSVQNYDSGNSMRHGNAVSPVASIEDTNGYKVTDGFVVENTYSYQCYDACLSFQYTGKKTGKTHSRVEKALFKNNVLEYSGANVSYWTDTESTNPDDIKNTYIGTFDIVGNIFRHAGLGIGQGSHKAGAGHIRTHYHSSTNAFNVIKNRFNIENNIFDGSTENYVDLTTDSTTLPTLKNNTFIFSSGQAFGYYGANSSQKVGFLALDTDILNKKFPGNKFIYDKEKHYQRDSGTCGDVRWEYNATSRTLNITGNGKMADYSLNNMAPWYKYKDKIHYIYIGKDVKKIGNYAFYDLNRVVEIKIDSINLSDLDTNNNAFYRVGTEYPDTELVFGKDVEYIPARLLKVSDDNTKIAYIENLKFEGDKVKSIGSSGLFGLRAETIVIPNGVEKIESSALSYNQFAKIITLPSSLSKVLDRSLSLNNRIEKLVFNSSIEKVYDNTFRISSCTKDLTIVLPDILDPSYASAATFENYKSNTVTVYGNSSTKTWVSNVIAASGQTNIIYKPLSDYKLNITSNTNINDTVNYNGTFTFTTDKSPTAYTYFVDKEGNKYKMLKIDVSKKNNSYIISNIKSDIYIEIK